MYSILFNASYLETCPSFFARNEERKSEHFAYLLILNLDIFVYHASEKNIKKYTFCIFASCTSIGFPFLLWVFFQLYILPLILIKEKVVY